MAHELVHHEQCCRGEFNRPVDTSPGYAQNDEHMRVMEEEAYNKGNVMLFRDWEDNYKKRSNVMSEAKENVKENTENPVDVKKPDVAKEEVTKKAAPLKTWYNQQIFTALMKRFVK